MAVTLRKIISKCVKVAKLSYKTEKWQSKEMLVEYILSNSQGFWDGDILEINSFSKLGIGKEWWDKEIELVRRFITFEIRDVDEIEEVDPEQVLGWYMSWYRNLDEVEMYIGLKGDSQVIVYDCVEDTIMDYEIDKPLVWSALIKWGMTRFRLDFTCNGQAASYYVYSASELEETALKLVGQGVSKLEIWDVYAGIYLHYHIRAVIMASGGIDHNVSKLWFYREPWDSKNDEMDFETMESLRWVQD